MSAEHTHAIPSNTKEKPLLLAFLLTASFFVAELVGGFITGSLALISDAAHMFTDVAALAIALAAIRIGRKPIDAIRTYGYYRFEILAALLNTLLLFLVAIYIIYEAYQRLYKTVEIQSVGMLVIATFGLIVNIVSMRLLLSGKDQSLNLKSAYLEVWSDMLGSVGVIIAAIVIKFTGWYWTDSVIAILIGLWVLPRTWILLKESINILLEGVPAEIDLISLKNSMANVSGITDIHDLHVWAITSGKVNLTAHVVTENHENCDAIMCDLRKMLQEKFNIRHTTLQHEIKTCLDKQTCNIATL